MDMIWNLDPDPHENLCGSQTLVFYVIIWYLITIYSSVLDPKLFIPDPDPASNFPSSGSGSRSGSNLY